MTNWTQLPADDRHQLWAQISLRTGLPAAVVEKDSWVVLLLEALYSLPGISEHLIFKGGTSLSKAYGLINRFSEDIDFALDRRLLGDELAGELSKNKINNKLRPASAAFVREQLMPRLRQRLLDMGVPEDMFSIIPKADADADADPLPLYVDYIPATDRIDYILPRVEIEAGFRSLLEPAEERVVTSLLAEAYPDAAFAGKPVTLLTVRPERTFLEKVFLLHEQFMLPADRALPRNRMSRHLYDVERLMDTEYATRAMADAALYDHIVAHREMFTPVRGITYERHGRKTIAIVPPPEAVAAWAADYAALTKNMIGGTKMLEFDALLARLTELQERFRLGE